MEMKSIRERLEQGVISAKVDKEPFPHFLLDNVFSESELDALTSCFPEERLFEQAGEGLKVFEIWRDADSLNVLSQNQRQLFRQINEELFTQDLAQLVFERFREDILDNFQVIFGHEAHKQFDQIELSDWALAGAINIREQGNCLPRHLDWPNRLISLVVYLDPEKGEQEDWGTRLYEIDKSSVENPWAVFSRIPEASEPEHTPNAYKQIPFRHGRIAVFLNSIWSYHGAVIEPTMCDARRFCIVKGINMTLESTEKIFTLPVELR